MVKWTPENDQTLLLKILETSNVSVDPKAIAAAWPTDKPESERPTPRAVTERLVKIRQTAKAQGAAGHFAVGSAKSKSSQAPRKVPSTPRKPAVKKEIGLDGGAEPTLPATPPATGSKRKHSQVIKQENNDEDRFNFSGDAQSQSLPSFAEPLSPSKRFKSSTYGGDHASLDSGYGSSFHDIDDFAFQEQVF